LHIHWTDVVVCRWARTMEQPICGGARTNSGCLRRDPYASDL